MITPSVEVAGRARYPRFKNRNSRQPAHYTRSAFRMNNGRLHLAKTSAPLEFVAIDTERKSNEPHSPHG